MAATVGASIGVGSLAFPLRHAGLGPFISSATGNVFFITKPSSGSTGNMFPYMASDPMSSFSSQTGKTMSSSSTTAIEAAAAYRVGDVIHVATQISTGAVYYNSYSIAAGGGSWNFATSETAVAAASQAPVSGTTFVDLVVRSTGSVVFAYNACQTAMSSTFNMVRYRIRQTNGVYGTATNIDNGGSVNWANGVAALGESDRVHFFLVNRGTADAYQRTLTAANALQTFPASFTTSVTSAFVLPGAISFLDAGTTRIRAAITSGAGLTEVAKLDSSDTPTATVEAAADGIASFYSSGGHYIQTLANDGTTLHLLYSSFPGADDLYHDSSAGAGGAWGTDVNEFTGTINKITANVYTRSGTKYLAMVLDDAGTLKYAEISLAGAPPPTTSAPPLGMRTAMRNLIMR